VLAEEMRRIGARPPLLGSGVALLLPTLLRFGTEGRSGPMFPDCPWRGALVPGLSEPEAGSDLASLRMSPSAMVRIRAERPEDVDIVCDGCRLDVLLGRTDTAAPSVRASHVPPGYEYSRLVHSPIRLINGDDEFCESFFDNVRFRRRTFWARSIEVGVLPSTCFVRAEDVRPWVRRHSRFRPRVLARESRVSLIAGAGGSERLDRLGLDELMKRAKSEVRAW